MKISEGEKVSDPGIIDTYEDGLTLECPSCHCPHSWVMTGYQNIVENVEKTVKTTRSSGYSNDAASISLRMAGASDAGYKVKTTTEVVYTYSGKTIKDFNCLNCGHQYRGEYAKVWNETEPNQEPQTCNPPKEAWSKINGD